MQRKINKLLGFISFYLYNRIMQIFLPLEHNKVVFASEARESVKGNLKAVYESLPSSMNKIVHIKGDRRESTKAEERRTLWRDLTTARVIVLDDYFGPVSAMKVRDGQEILQLWHGAGAFKKFGYSRRNSGDNIKNIHSGYRKYTKAITTSEPIRSCYAEAFGITIDKVWAAGTPRSDIFFNEEKKAAAIERVLATYPELKDRKIVLIAPTYRGSKVEDADYDFEKLKIRDLTKSLGEDYIVVTKWHPALSENIRRGLISCKGLDQSTSDDKIIDASEYSDINDLLIIAEVLVTDYSSVIFDYYLLNKPIVYYAYDLEEYENERGLYYDFKEYVYGQVVTDYKELVEAISDKDLSFNLREKFGRKFMSSCDGHSTERVCNWIVGETE